MTKKDVYVVVDTPKKAKKLKKVLDMFGERTYSNSSIQDCLDNNKNVIGFEKEDNAFMSSYVDQFDNFRKKVSIKELRNILAKENLREGDYVVSENNFICRIDKVENNGIHFSNPFVGVYDISYFKRYATPEEIALLEPKPKDLEVGKWYKHPNNEYPNWLVYYGENKKCYGFRTSGSWDDDSENEWFEYLNKYPMLEATPQEVESALIKEAKRRGLLDNGIRFKSPSGTDYGYYYNNGKVSYNIYLNILEFNYRDEVIGCCKIHLFNNGKWAEVVDKFAELKEANKNKEVVEFRREKTNNEWLDFFQNTPSWLNDPEYRINPEEPVKVGDWMLNPKTKKITQVKKDNHGKSLIGSGWVKIKDTELVEKLNSL